MDGESKLFLGPVPDRVPVTAVEGGGFSNVDSYYELEDGVLRWRGPER